MATYEADEFGGKPWTTPKDPDEARPYQLDFSNDMDTGDDITGTPTLTATPSGLTIGSPTVAGDKVTVQLSGGTAGRKYTIKCVASTVNGHTVVARGILTVSER